MYREKEGKKGPFKVIAVTNKNVTVLNATGGTLTFCSIHVKLYT